MKEELTKNLKQLLLDNGADLVGIGDLAMLPLELRKSMPFGICIALAIKPNIIHSIAKTPSKEYYDEYNELNEKLDKLVTLGAQYINNDGYEAYPQTREIVSEKETEYNSVLPYKTVATRAGIGWIGKNSLLITKKYGSAIRISTILTNAPLIAESPIIKGECGDCMICTKACPAQAVKGNNWSINVTREDIFDPVKCRKTARKIAKDILDKDITLCGKCIYVCPYTQAYIK